MTTGSGQGKYSGFERRKYFRHQLLYSPREAKLTINDRDYKVLDISQEGIRVEIDENMSFGKEVQGTLTLSNGESRDVKGTIVWMQDNEIGLKLFNEEAAS